MGIRVPAHCERSPAELHRKGVLESLYDPVRVRPADQQQVVSVQFLVGHILVRFDRQRLVRPVRPDRGLQYLGRLPVGRRLVAGAIHDQGLVPLIFE